MAPGRSRGDLCWSPLIFIRFAYDWKNGIFHHSMWPAKVDCHIDLAGTRIFSGWLGEVHYGEDPASFRCDLTFYDEREYLARALSQVTAEREAIARLPQRRRDDVADAHEPLARPGARHPQGPCKPIGNYRVCSRSQ